MSHRAQTFERAAQTKSGTNRSPCSLFVKELLPHCPSLISLPPALHFASAGGLPTNPDARPVNLRSCVGSAVEQTHAHALRHFHPYHCHQPSSIKLHRDAAERSRLAKRHPSDSETVPLLCNNRIYDMGVHALLSRRCVCVCRTPTLNPVNQLLAPPTLAPHSLFSTSLRGLRPNYRPPTTSPEEKLLPLPSLQVGPTAPFFVISSPFYCFPFVHAARIKGLLGNFSKGGLIRQTLPPRRSSPVACINNRVDA